MIEKNKLENSKYSRKLNWFIPDAFEYIRNLKTRKPADYEGFIDLSIGAPNRPTPEAICDELKKHVDNPAYHTYPPQFGAPELCEAVAEWYGKRFGVKVDPEKEVLITVGIKEIVFNAFHALLNPGETVLVPDPGYPTYFEAANFCGGEIIPYNSDCGEKEMILDLESKIKEIRPDYIIVNFPANPTGRLVSGDFYTELANLSEKYGTTVISDLAYSEIVFDGQKVSSYFSGKRQMANGIEFFAFSKTYNLAGWRVGAVVGDEKLVNALKLYKSKIDSNVFYPVQLAAAYALKNTEESFYTEQAAMYQARRDILCKGLDAAGLSYTKPQGAMYTWVKIPEGMNSWDFVSLLYDRFGVLGVPGIAYGENGKNYVRLGLVQEEDVMQIVSERFAEKKL